MDCNFFVFFVAISLYTLSGIFKRVPFQEYQRRSRKARGLVDGLGMHRWNVLKNSFSRKPEKVQESQQTCRWAGYARLPQQKENWSSLYIHVQVCFALMLWVGPYGISGHALPYISTACFCKLSRFDSFSLGWETLLHLSYC